MEAIISKLLGYAQSLKLSLTQWALLTLAGGISALVVAFKLQGSKLHKAQVQILNDHLNAQDADDEKAVASARELFNTAYNEYLKSKGTR